MYNQKYLQDLIDNKIEENLNLDYKSADALGRTDLKIKETLKDISSFANSDGGRIIYGIKEDTLNRHLPLIIDPLSREIISKEWLENIIQGRIRPRIEGINIHPIEIDNDPKKVVFLIDIPKSTTAHQADDKKYYKRFNFNSEPMYDYEVRDIMNRMKTPRIDLEFIISRSILNPIKPSPFLPASIQPPEPDLFLEIFATNNGSILAQYVNCNIEIPSECLIPDDDKPFKTHVVFYAADNTVRDFLYMEHFAPRYGPARYDPILPKQKIKLRFEMGKLNQSRIIFEKEIKWIVYADNAEPKVGTIKFCDIKIIDE